MKRQGNGDASENENDDPFAVPPAEAVVSILKAEEVAQPTKPRPIEAGSVNNPIHIRDPDLGCYTRWLMIWTSAIAIFALVSAAISYFQWRELRKSSAQTDQTIIQLKRQANAMNGQLGEMRAEQRPWIGAPRIEQNFPEVAGQISFTLIFKNVGKTATTGLYIGGHLVNAAGWDSVSRDDCEKGALRNEAGFKQSSMVPEDSLSIGDTPDKEITLRRTLSEMDGIPHPVIVGCVVYGSPFDQKRHKTEFYAPLKMIDGKAQTIAASSIDAN